jgi:hypothetical protein
MRDQGPKGWIGVDMDGTLAHYDKWVGWNVFGEPIEPMAQRVKAWLAEGKDVRIFTARIAHDLSATQKCYVTSQSFTGHMMVHAIQEWCVKHVGARLPVTCVKDLHMVELWDDRCVQVVPNTGRTVAEEAEARYNAARGKVFNSTSNVEDHPSHNVSDSFYSCYGCGLSVGNPGLKEPCPTPDAVGLRRMGK